MRFPESKIKEAILHPSLKIRQRAIEYFAKSFSTDPSVMPLVIQAAETFDKHEAYMIIGSSTELVQSPETISWIVGQLNDQSSGNDENYVYNLIRVLLEADVELLSPRESEIVNARLFPAALRQSFRERIEMRTWDLATCWEKLEALCEQGKSKRYGSEFNVSYGKRIVEAAARFGPDCEEKVHAILSQQVADYRDNPLAWLEPLTLCLAGQAKLESMIPLIFSKFEDGADMNNEEGSEALTRIGTESVLRAVAEVYPTAADSFRLYATNPLENIHADLAVEICLQLQANEPEYHIRSNLLYALLNHFPDDGMESARQFLIEQGIDFMSQDLMNSLLDVCTLTGQRFPEYDEWLAAEEASAAARRESSQALRAGFAAVRPPRPAAPRPHDQTPFLLPKFGRHEQSASKRKVGRNDPCPCGSGKKFKKCCLRDE